MPKDAHPGAGLPEGSALLPDGRGWIGQIAFDPDDGDPPSVSFAGAAVSGARSVSTPLTWDHPRRMLSGKVRSSTPGVLSLPREGAG